VATDRARSRGWTGTFAAIVVGAVIGGVVAYILPWLWFYYANGYGDPGSGPQESVAPSLAPLGAIVGGIAGGVIVWLQKPPRAASRASLRKRITSALGSELSESQLLAFEAAFEVNPHRFRRQQRVALHAYRRRGAHGRRGVLRVGSFEIWPSLGHGYGTLELYLIEYWGRAHRRRIRRGAVGGADSRPVRLSRQVANANDVRSVLREAGVPKDESERAAQQVFDDAVRWVRVTFELHVTELLPDQQPWPDRFMLVNQWTAVRGDRVVRVSAGSLRADAFEGIVVVATASAQVPLPEIERPTSWLSVDSYPAPGRHGPLAITEAAGHTVALEGTDMSTWVFDVSQRALRMIPAQGEERRASRPSDS